MKGRNRCDLDHLFDYTLTTQMFEEPENGRPPFLEERKFEVQTDIGKIILQVVELPSYKWVVITQANLLKMNGSLQVGFPTPYVTVALHQSHDPSVLNLENNSDNPESDDLCKRLSKQMNCAVVLSMNVEVELSIKDRKSIFEFLSTVLKAKQPPKEQPSK